MYVILSFKMKNVSASIMSTCQKKWAITSSDSDSNIMAFPPMKIYHLMSLQVVIYRWIINHTILGKPVKLDSTTDISLAFLTTNQTLAETIEINAVDEYKNIVENCETKVRVRVRNVSEGEDATLKLVGNYK